MKYITVIIDKKYMQVGGVGHILYDVISAYIISHLFNLQFVYNPINSLGNKHHTGEINGYTKDNFNWDSFLQLNKNELSMHDTKNLNLDKVTINLCNPFKSVNIKQLETFIQSHNDNTLFILTNNNRIYLNELFYFNNDIYTRVISNMKKKLSHLKNYKQTKTIIISMHIRRGDWSSQPISYNIEFIKLLNIIYKNINYQLNVYSIGIESQLNEIKNNLTPLNKNITFYFNTNVFETFSSIYNSDIVVGGYSNFPKIITMFSNNIFIYLPNNDGIIPALGVNRSFKTYHLGNYPEQFNKEKRIETDIYCNKNKDIIINKLNSLII